MLVDFSGSWNSEIRASHVQAVFKHVENKTFGDMHLPQSFGDLRCDDRFVSNVILIY